MKAVKTLGKTTEKNTSSLRDRITWVGVVLLITTGVVGNSYYTDYPLLYRVLGLLLLTGVVVPLALTTTAGRKFLLLLGEARTEIRKVVWPTHQETLRTVIMVLIALVVAAAILWGLDSILSWLASLLIV